MKVGMEDITPAEFVVMKCLHDLGEADIRQLLERLKHQDNETAAEWARTTVLTMLKSLQYKGFVERRREGKCFFYCPRKSLWQTVESILHRFLGSQSHSILCSYLAEGKTLTIEDQKRLIQLLEMLKDQ